MRLAGTLADRAPTLPEIDAVKTAILGANGAGLAVWIGRAANAYTDTTPAGLNHYQPGPGGVLGAGNVIRLTAGFTAIAGRGPGAIYEMREREVGIDRSGWLNIGSQTDIKAAVDKLFTVSQ